MKTAEEWNNYFATTESTYRQKGEFLLEWDERRYEMIQLDAIKEGMRRAAEMVLVRGGSSIRHPVEFYANEILSAADSLTL